jgi:hypothetical protein
VAIDGESLLLMWAPTGSCHGIAMGCKEFRFGGKPVRIPVADFEFTLPGEKPESSGKKKPAVTFKPIYRPMDMVEFSPKADCFTDQVEVAMSCTESNVDIRYTLDGGEPDGDAQIYTAPVVLRTTTEVKARAFRKGVKKIPPTVSGTEVTAVKKVVYTKEAVRKPAKATTTSPQGLNYWYYEENPFQLSSYVMDVINKPVKTGSVKELFDVSVKSTNGVYAFAYFGLIDIPADGVYSFHAPPEFVNPGLDCGYELRVFLGSEEWYPATRIHNYGAWSVPLQKGLHNFKVVWVDMRKQNVWEGENKYRLWVGEKPTLEISGPGLPRQPIPVNMLYLY